MKRWLKRIVATLVALLVSYVVVGIWLVRSESQREETWHDEAVKNTAPATESDWYAAAQQCNPVVELRYRPKSGFLYVVRIYEDANYVSALYPGTSDVTPLRIETGRIKTGEQRVLRERTAALYDVHEQVVQPEDFGNPPNVRLTIVHENRNRVLYLYRSNGYAALPQQLRDVDAALFEIMQSWSVKPAHGYARPVPQVSYGAETIPALVRGLESPREDLHASVVSRLVAIGDPALPELIRVLREGKAARYQPASRYLAVIDGVARLDSATGEGFRIIRMLSEKEARTPTERQLQRRAREAVKFAADSD